MQATERDVRAARTIVISDAVGAICVRDVNLDDYQIGLVVQIEFFDMFVLERDFKIGIEVRCQSCQPQRRKKRVLDWPPVGTGSFRQGRKNQFHTLDVSHHN